MLAEAEERDPRADIKEGEHVRLLTNKRWDFTNLVYSVDRMAG